MNSMRIALRLAFLLALCGALHSVYPQPSQDTITIRAIGPHIYRNAAIIKYIAQNAAPHRVNYSDEVDQALATPRMIINNLCGSFQEPYYALFLDRNKGRATSLTPDKPVGTISPSLEWPACLYVKIPTAPGYRAKVRPQEKTALEVYQRLTGGGGTARALQLFFKASIEQKVDLSIVQPGTILIGAHTTRPVLLTMEELSAKDFWDGLVSVAGGELASKELFNRIDVTDEGAVIVADTTECDAAQGPPYDAAAVANAYQHSSTRAASKGIDFVRAKVFVIDNGFFGADPRIGRSSRFKDSPFKEEYFQIDNDQLAMSLQMVGRDNFPTNFSYPLSPDEVSGHGTHVTGLVLGGPAFLKYRDTIVSDGKPWSRITIVNVGEGKKTLIAKAEQLLANSLPRDGSIINMSISYDKAASTNIASTFDSLFRGSPNLYITSAGNNYGLDVSNAAYPAGAGGLQSENVITVAALDGSGRIAGFSNVGADTVDLAAPGCEIQSWIRNDMTETPLSGTSQAAPLVTFAASLLRTLIGQTDVQKIKARLVASGSLLLDPTDQTMISSRVSLNIRRALFWFDDYVRVGRGDLTGEYIGTVTKLSGLQCVGSGHGLSKAEDVWSVKRNGNKLWSYLGRSTSKLRSPCDAVENEGATIKFVPSHRVTTDGQLVSVPEIEWTRSLNVVDEIIFSTPLK